MGHKINPTGFRTGITADWKSLWFEGKKTYAKFAVEDNKIRRFLEKKLENAGLKDIKIERSISSLRVKALVSRPGMVIGHGGGGVEELQRELKKLSASKVNVDIVEIRNPETHAKMVADSIARQVERRLPYKRAVNQSILKALEKGVKGIKIESAGDLSGASSLSRREVRLEGSVPSHTLRANIDYARSVAMTSYGNIGFKVWIYRGEER